VSWSRHELLSRAAELVRAHPTLRFGQALYNAAYAQNPAVAQLAGTVWDPFNDDSLVEAFLEKIEAR